VITAWRLCKTARVAGAFTGVGAAENPGRWNSAGTRIVNCAESRALAALEVLAHVEDKAGLAKARFSVIPVEIDDALILDQPALPRDWRRVPPPPSTRALGDHFVAAGTRPVLKVPSVIVLGEYNYLLNPAHPAFKRLRIGKAEPFPFDLRVIGSG
jgi:RES domain-containing protein